MAWRPTPTRNAAGWIAYQIVMALPWPYAPRPWRWVIDPIVWWLLPHAGYHAYRDPTPPQGGAS